MFERIILESFICHQDFTEFFEDYNTKNYVDMQRLFILPKMAKMYGYETLHDFLHNDMDTVQFIMKTYKEIVIEMFGKDESGNPNSDITDNIGWDMESQEAQNLGDDIISRIKNKLLAKVSE